MNKVQPNFSAKEVVMRNDITPDDLKKMKLVNIEAVDAESLVDIRDVKINPDISKEERIE